MSDDKLALFKERFENSRAGYGELSLFAQRLAQFEGTKKIPGGRDASVVWNFTSELIESQIDSSIPMPRVRPRRPTRRSIRQAKVIEDMLRGELDRMPFEELNDLDERMCKVMGGGGYLVEWDNSAKTHDTVGALSVRLLSAPQIIPQQAIDDVRRMDYIFLTFEDTKQRIRDRYGVDVEDEGVDAQSGSFEQHSDETVTQVICYYKNERGGLGCFSWAGDTVLLDDDDYEARKNDVCAGCGKTRAQGERVCVCGAHKWKKRSKLYETVPESELGVTENYSNLSGAAKQPPAMMEKSAYVSVEYYYPKLFPVVIRKNISRYGHMLGSSDCDAISDFQYGANKLLTKINERLLKSGTYLAKPATMNFQFSDGEMQPINLDTPDQAAMLRTIELRADVSQDAAMVDKYYDMARSVLGVTDSFQGKSDATAISGKAKQAQIAQAVGRQKSKRMMKHAAYARLFELMFQFMLAYADEPRVYTSTDEYGEQVERVFSRHDFLERDDYGNWYYNDQFLFSVDESGIDANDKQLMLEDLRTDLSIGAYGPPNDAQTMLAYWKEKEVFGYPNASRNVARWEKKAEAEKQGGINGENALTQGGFNAAQDLALQPAGALEQGLQ